MHTKDKILGYYGGTILTTANICDVMSYFEPSPDKDFSIMNKTPLKGGRITMKNAGNCLYDPAKEVLTDVTVKKVIFNPPATIVIFEDGSKSVVKAAPNEAYDREKGFAMAVIKRIYGSDGGSYYNYVKKWCMEKEPEIIPPDKGLTLDECLKHFDDLVYYITISKNLKDYDEIKDYSKRADAMVKFIKDVTENITLDAAMYYKIESIYTHLNYAMGKPDTAASFYGNLKRYYAFKMGRVYADYIFAVLEWRRVSGEVYDIYCYDPTHNHSDCIEGPLSAAEAKKILSTPEYSLFSDLNTCERLIENNNKLNESVKANVPETLYREYLYALRNYEKAYNNKKEYEKSAAKD